MSSLFHSVNTKELDRFQPKICLFLLIHVSFERATDGIKVVKFETTLIPEAKCHMLNKRRDINKI